jgi:CubicO group peptidase (beta-lactamase class C family)
MHRRAALLGGGAVAAGVLAGPALARSEGPNRLQAWLKRWLAAFNDEDLRVYKAFVERTAPSVVPYVDDDLSVRETVGGVELLAAEIAGPNEISALVKDRVWDRRSRVVLRASDSHRLDDIAFAAAPSGPATSRLNEAVALAAIQGKLDAEGKAARLSGAVLVARGDAVILRTAQGLADDVAANSPATRFCIGSMGKMFTAVAVMQAVEAGLVQLDAPVRTYLPDYPNAAVADRVTVRQLLTHTGGTGDIFGPGYDGRRGSSAQPAHLVRLYGERPPQFEPGSRWGYSNYGFVLLGRILEVVRAKPYASLVEDQVFRPAGMASTSMAFDHARPTAAAYTGARATGLKALPPYVGLPAGGGYSSVDDLHAFVAALRNGRLVRRETLAAMVEPRVVAGSAHWGLGFAVRTRNGLSYFGHGGAAPGVNGDLAVFPDYTTIVLCNRGHPAAACVADFMGARLPAAA